LANILYLFPTYYTYTLFPTPKQVPISANLAKPSSKSHITPQIIPTPKSSETMTFMDDFRKNQVSRPISSLLSFQTTWRGHIAKTTSQKLAPQNKTRNWSDVVRNPLLFPCPMHILPLNPSILRPYLAHPSPLTKQVHTNSQLSKLQWEDPNLSRTMNFLI